jgi:hypothetical protein
MSKDINKMIEEGFELAKKHDQLRQELLNNPTLPQEMLEVLKELEGEIQEQGLRDEEYIEKNKHRKIIGYDSETFMPIYED